MADPLESRREAILQLTAAERKRLLAGDHSALKRDEDPGDVEGQEVPLVRRLAHTAPTFEPPRFSGESPRFKDLQEVPEYWSVWLKVTSVTRHRKGHWQIEIDVHDERQKARVLRAGGVPGLSSGPGLKTRLKDPERAKAERGKGVGSFTDETARGYGGAGRHALDHGGLEDSELEQLAKEAKERWDRFVTEERAEEQAAQEARRLAVQIDKAQRKAAKLGVDIGPVLLRALEDAQELMAEERQAA